MAENAILFFAYNELQNLIRRLSSIPSAQVLSLPQLALAAAGAGAITSYFLCVVLLFPTPDSPAVCAHGFA
jgi:ornithine carrier protein